MEVVFFIPSVLVRPMFGWLVDRFGRLKVLWAGTILMILSSFAFSFLHGAYVEIRATIAVILLIRGCGFAAFYTSFFTFVADLTSPENRSRILGLFGVSGLIAHGLAPWIGDMVLQRFDFRGFFLASSALSATSMVLSVFLTEIQEKFTHQGTPVALLKSVTFSRKNLIFLPGAFVFGYLIASFNTFGAAYFESLQGGGSIGRFFLVYGLVAGVFRVLFGGIADRYSRQKLIALAFAMEGLGIALIVIHPVEYFAIAAAAICGSSHALIYPAMTAMAIDAHSDAKGVVTSVFTAMIEFGYSLGSYALGWVIAMSSYSAMFVSCAVFALMFAGYVLFYRQAETSEVLI